jgi:Ran GTPase-activating protein (RanGAP) involved in mRNA processing and transport
MPIDNDLLEQLKTDKTLTKLDLSNKRLSDRDTQALMKALSENHTLTSLNVGRNQIGAIGAKALSENHTLTSLDVDDNQIGAIGVKALSENHTLASLNVSDNQIGDEGAKALSENHTLTSLDIRGNQIGAIGVKALSENHTLTSLNVYNNQIGTIGAKALSENHTLTSLDVSWNQIGDEGAKALSQNHTLTSLDVRGNQISDAMQQQLAQRLAANKQRQVAQRTAFILRLDQGLRHVDKVVEMQELVLPRELIAHIGAYLDARFYLQLADIQHPAHIAKTAQQVYGCALFLLLQEPGRVKDHDIVEHKDKPAYQPFMFKPAACTTQEQPAAKKRKPPVCPIL